MKISSIEFNFAVATVIIFADGLWKVVFILYNLSNKLKKAKFITSKIHLEYKLVSTNKKTPAFN